jgi:nitrite reductase (NO-forming)/hydroxylamine reductase
MKILKTIVTTGLVLFGIFSSSLNAEEVVLSDAEMKKGADIYFNRCAGCHGMLRKGALGPSLLPEKMKEYGTETLKSILWNGTNAGMPDWGASGEMSKADTELMAKYIQNAVPPPKEMSMNDMKKSHKVYIPVKDRPKAPQTNRDWKNYMGVVLRDTGKVAIIDGESKELVSLLNSGFAVHILRTSASGRYMYTIGRDGKATVIDLWMKKPETVAEVKTCYDARSIDTSKYKGPKGDFMDKLAVIGCYWPSSIVTLNGETLEPLKIVSTASYNVSTGNDENGNKEDTVFTREARVAAIIASHAKPEWVINIKEAGQVWLYDYSDYKNPTIKMIEAERFLHDGGWDSSKQYMLVAANARDRVVAIDVKNGKLAGIIPTGANKPHPGRGANVNSPLYGPIWLTGHIGDKKIVAIGTDPKGHPKNAWKIVKSFNLPGEGGGNLFVKTHPKSKHIYADRPLNPDKGLQNSIFVIDKNKLEVVKQLQIPAKYMEAKVIDGKEIKPRGPVHFEFNANGDEVWVAVWGNKMIPSAILVYDDKTLVLKKAIEGDWVRTPTGHFNVTNTMKDVY